MRELELSADEVVSGLLRLSRSEPVYILDSCGVGHLGSHLLVASLRPLETAEVSNEDPEQTLLLLDKELSGDLAAFFTLSYDFGLKLHRLVRSKEGAGEPDLFLAIVDFLIIHDYDSGRTRLAGNESRFEEIVRLLVSDQVEKPAVAGDAEAAYTSTFTRSEYVDAVDDIRGHIRAGDTYQTNLTQRLEVTLAQYVTPDVIFARLRRDHPAPFAAFLGRSSSTVVSASPERFFRIGRDGIIDASPIKGTRRRGANPNDDEALRAELESSEKDRAENTMIVDLVRNDLGRVCDFGSVVVEKLCEIEEHPTLFHLVSTVRGKLSENARLPDIIRALFPCGSITGAPKIRTMQIIDEIEPIARGLSMGAIGVRFPAEWKLESIGIHNEFDLSVAIRTMVIQKQVATFSVGGGIVIDSDPEKEFDESLLKAHALLKALA